MSHPPDIATAADWIKANVGPEFAREVADALPALPVGTAFVCSAQLDIGERGEVRPRLTFTSGATPVPGERRAEPKVPASVDSERLGREIASSARRAQENSPEFLRRRIAELETNAGGSGASGEEVARLRAEAEHCRAAAERAAFAGYSNPRSGGFAGPAAALVRKALTRSLQGSAELIDAGREAAHVPSRPATTEELQERIFALLGTGERTLLTLLIRAYPESLTREKLSREAGYSNPKSGGFAQPLARLLEPGFAEAAGTGVVRGSDLLVLKRKAR